MKHQHHATFFTALAVCGLLGGLLAHNASAIEDTTNTEADPARVEVLKAVAPYDKAAALKQLQTTIKNEMTAIEANYQIGYINRAYDQKLCVTNDEQDLYSSWRFCATTEQHYKIAVLVAANIIEQPEYIGEVDIPHQQWETNTNQYYDTMSYDEMVSMATSFGLTDNPSVAKADALYTDRKSEYSIAWRISQAPTLCSMINDNGGTCTNMGTKLKPKYTITLPTTLDVAPFNEAYGRASDMLVVSGYQNEILPSTENSAAAASLDAKDGVAAQADSATNTDLTYRDLMDGYADLYLAAQELKPNLAVDLTNVPSVTDPNDPGVYPYNPPTTDPTDPDEPNEPNTPGDSTTDSSDQTSASSTPSTPGTGTVDQARDSSAVSFTFLAGFTAFSLSALILHRKHSKTRKIQQRLH